MGSNSVSLDTCRNGGVTVTFHCGDAARYTPAMRFGGVSLADAMSKCCRNISVCGRVPRSRTRVPTHTIAHTSSIGPGTSTLCRCSNST